MSSSSGILEVLLGLLAGLAVLGGPLFLGGWFRSRRVDEADVIRKEAEAAAAERHAEAGRAEVAAVAEADEAHRERSDPVGEALRLDADARSKALAELGRDRARRRRDS